MRSFDGALGEASRWALLTWAALICAGRTAVGADEVVAVGAGSYAVRAPAGAKVPPTAIYRTANARGPMPTNDWWSSLAWLPLSEAMYPHPLAVQAVTGGLRVYYPGAKMAANASAIFASMPHEGGDDFVIGHSAVETFAEARVDGFSDWFVSALFEEEGKKLRTTFGHGSPFVFVELTGGNPTLRFGRDAPKIWSGNAGAAVLGISVENRHYGIFAPTGTTWSPLTGPRWTAQLKDRSYFSVAVLPDDSAETLALFAKYAHNHVTQTQAHGTFEERTSLARTVFTFVTRSWEGAADGTLFALYPHQWRSTKAPLLGYGYDSVRGPMKLGAGSSFVTEMTYPGVLPALPLAVNGDQAQLDRLIDAAIEEKPRLVSDTYGLGKQLGRWATLLPIAEQTGHQRAIETLTAQLKAALENFFTATDELGALKSKDQGLFFYEPNWGTLIGFPASYGSDAELNDHHFHYGYFIRATGEIARRDPGWAASEKWGAMVKLLIRDIASSDRRDPMFPYMRSFDVYAGHTWASGHGRFGDGNNNESSSEAMNAWYGMILLGAATADQPMMDAGAWLFTNEMEAINHYWFDVTGQFHHPDYPASVVTMIWGGKGANGTWFSRNPELVHGINWLPWTGGSLYLGRYPDYAKANYAALVTENRLDDAKKAAGSGKVLNPDGTRWDEWGDIVWMYLGLSDPDAALKQFEARAATFKPEAGNSLANVHHWLHTLSALGQVDRNVTADTPFYAVFTKAGRKTHVAYNMHPTQPRTVTFSDGVTVPCAPKSFGMK